jgi:3-methyladenine DNA glycosylase AlkD
MTDSTQIINKLKTLSNPKNVEGMKRFAVGGKNTLGISIPVLRKMAKAIIHQYTNITDGTDKRHRLALELWKSGIHEARILAAFTAVPEYANLADIDKWVHDFDSWDICDQTCNSYFKKTVFSRDLVDRYIKSDKEFVKRTAFVMMAVLAVHDKKMANDDFAKFFPPIIKESNDDRNFVKKAVNWALRQIGKRNQDLNKLAIETAREIIKKYPDSKSARWIANDTIRELKNKSFS